MATAQSSRERRLAAVAAWRAQVRARRPEEFSEDKMRRLGEEARRAVRAFGDGQGADAHLGERTPASLPASPSGSPPGSPLASPAPGGSSDGTSPLGAALRLHGVPESARGVPESARVETSAIERVLAHLRATTVIPLLPGFVEEEQDQHRSEGAEARGGRNTPRRSGLLAAADEEGIEDVEHLCLLPATVSGRMALSDSARVPPPPVLFDNFTVDYDSDA
jgi:hypothetical protein